MVSTITSQRIVSPELTSSAKIIAILRTFSLDNEDTVALPEHPSNGFTFNGMSLMILSPLNTDLEEHTDVSVMIKPKY